ncbi:MAG: InlB B-repeat-containing protein [Methanosarcinales archaeon]|jgi:uncharacterized repeat protein (TIGR02543 family)|nr:InlB B-repeat-containing protein [Methanosarcinales archaeon]
MKQLKKQTHLLIILLIISSAFSGIAAAEENTPEIEYFPRENIERTESDETGPEMPEIPAESNEFIEANEFAESNELTEANPESASSFEVQQFRMPLIDAENEIYGNPTVVEITTKQQLLDEILNALGTKETDGGKRVIKTYKLMDDFTVYDSELSRTHFKYQYHGKAGTLYNNIDGNNKKITVIADTPEPARPLLNRINDIHNTTKNDRLFVKDLTVEYVGDGTHTGDVKVSPFVNDNIKFCDLENIKIEVEGDIIADYRLYRPEDELCARASGFAERIESIPKTDDNGSIIYDDGQAVYEETILQDIEISAKTLGYVSGKTPENLGQWIGFVNGLTIAVGFGVLADNITLNYERIDGTSQWISDVAGYAQFASRASNITVNVAGDIVADGQLRGGPDNNANGYANVCGISEYGSHLKDSAVNVGGNITAVLHEKGVPAPGQGALITGLVNVSNSHMIYNKGAEFINNSVIIRGNMTAEAPTKVFITGGVGNHYGDYKNYPRTSKNNAVTIYGNMEAVVNQTGTGSYGTTQSIVTGMNSGIRESTNDTLKVYGNMTSYCQKGSSYLIGHSWGISGDFSLYDSLMEVHGVMRSTSDEKNAIVQGMSLGEMKEHRGNKMTVFNEQNEPHGIYAETLAAGEFYAESYGYGGSVSKTSPTQISENAVYVNKNITAKGPEAVVASGFIYSFSNAKEDSVISGNIIFVNGSIYAEAKDTREDYGTAYSSGLITYAGKEIKRNAVYVKDKIRANVTMGNGYAAGFALTASGTSQIYENTWLGKPGKPSTSGVEIDASYENFIAETSEGAQVRGNFYTSVLEGQRVTDELVLNATSGLYEAATSEKKALTEVSPATDYSAGVSYIRSADSEIGTFGFAGVDAADAVLSGDELTLPKNAFVMLTANEGGKQAVKDIPGIGSQHMHGNITGAVFTDFNDNGEKDAGEETANVIIKAYYEGSEAASGQTDENGVYTFKIPLLSVQNPSLVLKMDYPDGRTGSSHPNNIFGETNKLPVNLTWTEPAVLKGFGILSKTITVRFDSQGGTPVISITNAAQDSLITEPAPPSKTGFIFGGWFNESECVNSWDFDADIVTDDMTLYAKWTPETHNGSGFGGGIGNAVVKENESAEENVTAIQETETSPENNVDDGRTEDPMQAMEKEIRVLWISILLFILPAFIAFAYRRKKEKDEEDEYLNAEV